MLDPVDHIEYYFVKGQGWVPQVIRQAQPNNYFSLVDVETHYIRPGIYNASYSNGTTGTVRVSNTATTSNETFQWLGRLYR